MESPIFWIGFNVFVLAMLALDLGVFHRKAHVVTIRESAFWVTIWTSLSLLFSLGVLWLHPRGWAAFGEYLTGYVLEQSLSMDNIFVIALIFSSFAIPQQYQHRVLFWGIIGVLILRGAMIGVGAALIHQFDWILYVFGAFLVYTGIKMGFSHGTEDVDPANHPAMRFTQRFMPVTPKLDGQNFFVRVDGKRMATPLFVVLIIVETTDLVFAVDSIPAIFGVTKDPFIVYTSNVFAVLGLRSLYFLLAGMMGLFRYLKHGLAAILVFVGLKMLHVFHFMHLAKETEQIISIGVIFGILGASILASLIAARESGDLARLATKIEVEDEKEAEAAKHAEDATATEGETAGESSEKS